MNIFFEEKRKRRRKKKKPFEEGWCESEKSDKINFCNYLII